MTPTIAILALILLALAVVAIELFRLREGTAEINALAGSPIGRALASIGA